MRENDLKGSELYYFIFYKLNHILNFLLYKIIKFWRDGFHFDLVQESEIPLVIIIQVLWWYWGGSRIGSLQHWHPTSNTQINHISSYSILCQASHLKPVKYLFVGSAEDQIPDTRSTWLTDTTTLLSEISKHSLQFISNVFTTAEMPCWAEDETRNWEHSANMLMWYF